MRKRRRILTGELITNKVLGVEMHNCLKPEEKNVLQQMLLAKVIWTRFVSLGSCGCSLAREPLPPSSYFWAWAGEEYLVLGSFVASLPAYVAAFVDSTSGTTECLPQTSGAEEDSGEQQHRSRWHSGTSGKVVSQERPCSQWQRKDNYTGTKSSRGQHNTV